MQATPFVLYSIHFSNRLVNVKFKYLTIILNNLPASVTAVFTERQKSASVFSVIMQVLLFKAANVSKIVRF